MRAHATPSQTATQRQTPISASTSAAHRQIHLFAISHSPFPSLWMEVCPARLGERRAFHRPTARSLRAGPSAFLDDILPPGWECQAGRAFAAVRGRTRRRGGLRNAFTNFVAYAAGSDARRTFHRFPAAEARRPAPEALRGQARGTLGGWKVVGCLRGRLWGEPPGEPPGVTPRPCGARRAALALKNASLLICFFRCISSLFPLFAVLNNICPARTFTGRIGTSPSLLANRLQWPSAQRHHRTDAKSIGAALELPLSALLSALTSSEARLTVAGERAPDRRRSSVRPPPRLPCP